mmetsp:Transcript_42689/g.48513  ORF Transcript_42689/g.48513 Transcript_42689/m.48513 type:complete len:179 (+) Transcript_42689:47-583(+)
MLQHDEKPLIDPAIFGFWVLVAAFSCVLRAGWLNIRQDDLKTMKICKIITKKVSKIISRILLAIFMIGAASMRLNPKVVDELLCPIVPPPLPPKLCVYASGIVEFIGAILLLLPFGLEKYGGMLILLLLWAVFPANIYHALSIETQNTTNISQGLYLRIFIQFLFIGWSGWHAAEESI